VAHFLGHYLVGLLNYSEQVVEYIKLLFDGVMWILLSYGAIHIAIEFLHFFASNAKRQSDAAEMQKTEVLEFIQGIKFYSSQTEQIQNALEQLNVRSPVGIVKKIEESNIFEFTTDYIYGWNPNWSIELADSNLAKSLREIHRQRITSNSVKKIEYIFFENYKIDNTSDQRFGSKDFLYFLERIKGECCLNGSCQNNQAFVALKNGMSKYIIWIVEENIYAEDNPCFNDLNKYINFIFLSGTKLNSNANMLIFVNTNGFIVNGQHKYYIELFDGNQIYSDFSTHFANTTRKLKANSINPKKVIFNESADKFELEDI
jgi:hypothetical protein